MIKKCLFAFSLTLALHADVMHFYRTAVKTLAYNRTYSLHKQSAVLSQQGIFQSQYADFSVDSSYSDTSAKNLQDPFNTFDVSLSDTIDIFNKKNYHIQEIALDMKEKNAQLNVKKEQLFRSLVAMIALYHSTYEKSLLSKKLYEEQLPVYKNLKSLQRQGGITNLDLLRFQNRLTALQMKLIAQNNELKKMKKQFKLYAPNIAIPPLDSKIKYSNKAFVLHDPHKKMKMILAKRSLVQSKAKHANYLPELKAGIAYENNGDPSSYGDNYSFNIALHMPLSRADSKESEALKVNALSQKSETIALKVQREQEYITLAQNYENAQDQFKVLRKNLRSYRQRNKEIKTAFTKQFVDFNSYIQVLMQTLRIEEKMQDLKYEAQKEATIINAIASGAIYE